VRPDVTFGVPFRFLFASDHREQFGHHLPDDPEIERELEPD
jgi:hypothetical protein